MLSLFRRVTCRILSPPIERSADLVRVEVRGVELLEERARRQWPVKTVYFDTNAFVDVFEDRKPGRFAKVQDLARRELIRPVASDALLKEVAEGSQKPNFDLGITRFFSLDSRWMLAGAGLRQRCRRSA